MKNEEATEAAEFVALADERCDGRHGKHHARPQASRGKRLEGGGRNRESTDDVQFEKHEGEPGDGPIAERRLQDSPANRRVVFPPRGLEGTVTAA
jgi:hypothetical protein